MAHPGDVLVKFSYVIAICDGVARGPASNLSYLATARDIDDFT